MGEIQINIERNFCLLKCHRGWNKSDRGGREGPATAFSRLPGRCTENRHTWPDKAQEEGRDEHARKQAPTKNTHTHMHYLTTTSVRSYKQERTFSFKAICSLIASTDAEIRRHWKHAGEHRRGFICFETLLWSLGQEQLKKKKKTGIASQWNFMCKLRECAFPRKGFCNVGKKRTLFCIEAKGKNKLTFWTGNVSLRFMCEMRKCLVRQPWVFRAIVHEKCCSSSAEINKC